MPTNGSRVGFLALIALFAGNAVAQTTLSVLGASNGSIEVQARTEDVSIPLVIESAAAAVTDLIIRPTPFVDASNHLHVAQIRLADGATAPQLGASIPAAGTFPVEVVAKLGPEGKYTGELLLLVGQARSSVKITVTRALEDADVEILGIEQITASASSPTRATLRLTLVEKSSRALALHKPVLIEYARKKGTARSNASFKIESLDPTADPISLVAGESKELKVHLTGFERAGEYVGKIRFTGTGFKPADAAFTVILRESAWIAFWMIFFGVMLSVLLRWLTQKVRPQLLERRRLYRLILLVDALKREPAREAEEAELLDALRAECVAWAGELESDKISEVKGAVDLLEARRKLFIEWAPWRRRVRKLTPPELAQKFWPIIQEVAQTIRAESTKEAIDASVAKLRELRNIDAELGKILQVRIGELNDAVEGASTRAGSRLASEAQGQLAPLLREAKMQLEQNNQQAALDTYSRARSVWATLLFSDLADVLKTELPLRVDDESKRRLIDPLVEDAKQSEELLKTDPDYAIRQYNVILNRYVAALCELLLVSCDKVAAEIEASEGGSLTGQKAAELSTQLEAACGKVAAIREKSLKGDRQSALSEIWELFREVARVRKLAASPGTRSKHPVSGIDAIDSTAPDLPGTQLIPGGLSDPERRNFLGVVDDRPITESSVSFYTQLANAIDLFSTAIAIIVASVLGITTLWANDPTWGGWQDYLVCLLWGLGLHQFTFAGVNNLRDRISGNEAAGNAQ